MPAHDPENSTMTASKRPIASLGRNALGEQVLVAIAVPLGLERLAVVQRIWPDLTDEADAALRFVEAARPGMRLRHPNIVRTFEVGQGTDLPRGEGSPEVAAPGSPWFIATEYLAGQSLTQVLRRLRGWDSFTLPMRLELLVDVLRALEYAHDVKDRSGSALPAVHGDIGPDAVLIGYDGAVKLRNFGWAAALLGPAGRRRAGSSYGAPELLRGARPDRRADLFAVGCLLWELMTERGLFRGHDDIEVVKALSGEIPMPALPQVWPVPDELKLIVERALRLAPEARYQTAAEFRCDLEEILTTRLPAEPRSLGQLVTSAFRAEREALQEHIDRGGFSADIDPADNGPSLPAPVNTRAGALPPKPSYLNDRITGTAPAVEVMGDQPSLMAPPVTGRSGGSQIAVVLGALLVGLVLVLLIKRPDRLGWLEAPRASAGAAPAPLVDSPPAAPVTVAAAATTALQPPVASDPILPQPPPLAAAAVAPARIGPPRAKIAPRSPSAPAPLLDVDPENPYRP
jgi:serine/threonine protein kinase